MTATLPDALVAPTLEQQMAEGWLLADVEGTGLLQIQRSQNSIATFTTDALAVEYVRGRAAAGSGPHVAAYRLHADGVQRRRFIRDVFLRHGFTIKPGCDDLKPYVYAAALALLKAAGVSHV